MDGGPIDRLTEKQRACLRLVQQHYTSKQIARELGIGVDAVDQRIKCAMKTLGVSTRAEAVRTLGRYESIAAVSGIGRTAERAAKRPAWSTRFDYLLRRIGPGRGRSRFLVWACLIGLLLAFIRFAEPLEDALRDARFSTRTHAASGEIVLVALDNRTVEALGGAPLPRGQIGLLVQQLARLRANRIVFIEALEGRTDHSGDAALARVLQSLGNRIVLGIHFMQDREVGRRTNHYPLPEFRKRAILAHTSFEYWLPGNTVRRLPYFLDFPDQPYPSVSMVLAHRTAGMAADFPLDLSIDPQTIPRLSALDVIRGSVPMNAIAEKDVVISYTNTPIDFPFVIPNRGEFATVYLHIIGAETLKRRPVFELKWFFTFIPALCLVLACWRIRRARFTAISLASGAATILLLPFALEPYAVFYDSMAALMLWTIVAVGLTYRARREARLLRFAAERPPAQTTDTAYSSALANNQTAC